MTKETPRLGEYGFGSSLDELADVFIIMSKRILSPAPWVGFEERPANVEVEIDDRRFSVWILVRK